jgi:hypothetical protein
MTALPSLDFNGEDGIAGGSGQQGGGGGSGGDGHLGDRWWLFGWHCSSEGGDGGDGGNGGRGGDGGRGGNGGHGGQISVGVLTGTLESTVVAKSSKIKNQGGHRVNGGAVGLGGSGGAGGQSGNGDTCTGAKNGHSGAQGQPGSQGPAGWSDGPDALVSFFKFTEAAWDDLMTRPWITQVTPADAFPGDTLTVHGSRFTAADTVVVAGSPLPSAVNADESVSVSLPLTLPGGLHQVFVRRAGGVESNRVNVGIKPELDALVGPLPQGDTVTLTGRAFLPGAAVLFNNTAIPATAVSQTSVSFPVPGTGGAGSGGEPSRCRCAIPTGGPRTCARPSSRASWKYRSGTGSTT